MSYLFLELFLISLALAATRWCVLAWNAPEDHTTILIPGVFVLWGAAIGGLFNKIWRGAIFGGAFCLILLILDSMTPIA